jgi:uncharacterized membrane protein YuzA (DUF378 family)
MKFDVYTELMGKIALLRKVRKIIVGLIRVTRVTNV